MYVACRLDASRRDASQCNASRRDVRAGSSQSRQQYKNSRINCHAVASAARAAAVASTAAAAEAVGHGDVRARGEGKGGGAVAERVLECASAPLEDLHGPAAA